MVKLLACTLFCLLSGCPDNPADSTGNRIESGDPDPVSSDNGSEGQADAEDSVTADSDTPSEQVNQMAADAIALEEQRRLENGSTGSGSDRLEDEVRVLVQRDLVAAADGVYDITFDDLMFEMETGEQFSRGMLTENIRTLHKERIRIRGYIHPSAQRTGNRNFIFVRDDKECCFGPQAALYDCILVSLDEGVTADFSARPIMVEGLFFVREYKIGDQILAIYNMRHGRVN